MRLGVVLDTREAATMHAEAAAAEAAGLDCCLVRDEPASAVSATALAATLASATTSLPVVVEIAVGGHPFSLAEELAVCDLLLGGRLAIALAGDDDVALAETRDVLRRAFAGERITHRERRWQFPLGGTPGVTLTPGPAQLAPPIWPAFAPRRMALASREDVERAVRELSPLDSVGLCVLELAHADPDERLDAIRLAGSRLRPRLQGPDLPGDLVDSWD